MSLFPAAQAITEQVETTSGKSHSLDRKWLKNESFGCDSASSFVKLQSIKTEDDDFSSSESSDSDRHKQVERREGRTKHNKREGKRHHVSLEKDGPRAKLSRESVEKDRSELRNGQKLSVILENISENEPRFCSDKQKDMDNVHFGRLYKVGIPKYYRDLIHCVGTPKWKVIRMTETRKKKKRKKNLNNDYRYFSCSIPVPAKVQSELNGSSLAITAPENVIKFKTSETVADVDHFEVDSSRGITESLNRKTREEPHNIEAWLELVSWQDEAMKDIPSHRRCQAVNEKKVEILNQAIKANSKVQKLQLMRIKLRSELSMDPAALDKEWQNLLFRFPDNFDVWQGYISHITCSDYSAFSIKRTKRAFMHCLEILMSIRDGTYKQETNQVNAEERLIQVFSEYTDFLAATGHTEQFFALYQCMMELNFRGPPDTLDRADILDYLGKYYQGKDPKLGEKGSRGFGTWVSKHEAGGWVTPMDPVEEEEEEEIDEDDVVKPELGLTENWLKLEEFRCQNHWMPWKESFEAEECEDSERKVHFKDIKDLLFVVHDDNLKIQLVRNFLRGLGCPIQYFSSSFYPFNQQHPFFFTHPHHALKQQNQCFGTAPLTLLRGTIGHTAGFTEGCRGCVTGALNSKKHVLVCEIFSQLLMSSGPSLSVLLKCEVMLYYESRIISYHLAQKPQSVRKSARECRRTAKKILASNPELMPVWCKLAVIEWLAGKQTEACKIFQTAMSLTSSKLGSLDRRARTKKEAEIHYLCSVFSQLHFYACPSCAIESDEACPSRKVLMHCLAALGDKYKFSEYFSKSKTDSVRPTNLMKANAGYIWLNENVESLFEQEEYEKEGKISSTSSYLNTFCCRVIYLFMSEGDTRDVVRDGITFLQKKISTGSQQAKVDLEQLCYLHLTMLKKDLKRNRSNYREALYSAVSFYPTNPIFAQMVSEVDLSSYLSSNVRRHFTRVCHANRYSVVPWLCALQFELMRKNRVVEASAAECGTNETNRLLDTRIRNMFEHAIKLNSGSVVLWRAYMAVEAVANRDNIKSIYTRAVNACSWSRDLHIDMLAYHPEQLEEIVNNMGKKGLRVRTPVEEVQLLMTV